MVELNRHILEQVALSSAEGIIVIDATTADLDVVYVNPASEMLTGYDAEETVGRPWRLLAGGGEDTREIAALRAAIGRGESTVTTLPDLRHDGTTWLSRTRAQPIHNRRGELKQYLVMQSEVQATAERQHGLQVGLLQRELRRARQKAADLDRFDAATGLLRYERFLEVADRDCRIARRDQEIVAVAVFEINDIEAYRQTFGAKAAESCLRMIGAQVTNALRRAGDLCGCDDQNRIMALSRGQNAEQFGKVAERIATNVRRLGLHNPRGRTGRYITVSFGIAAGVPATSNALAILIDEAQASFHDGLETAPARRSAGA